ncbi:MAG TPA: (2Fe-2S)-binding protein [Candidatus Dormibacteraeota bacterium]
MNLALTVNGQAWSGEVEPRLSLADLLRERLRLTGTHLGCEQGPCGACTVLLDDEAVRSCLLLAVQADGHAVTTAEGVDLDLGPVFQCGFCRPGFTVTAEALRRAGLPASEEALSGNICRCTGYGPIVDAVRRCLT